MSAIILLTSLNTNLLFYVSPATFYFVIKSDQLASSLPSWLLLIPLLSFVVSFVLSCIFKGIDLKTHFYTKILCKIPAWLILLNFSIVICLLTRFSNGEALYAIWNINKFRWIDSWPFVLVSWEFYVDSVTLWMLFAINGISCIVHFYSLGYMKTDPNILKFLSYLSLFTFFMIVLVCGNNFLLLFFGWEGVGLSSFLLISFWHTRAQANKSAIKALIVNRVADLALTIGIILVYFTFKTLNFQEIFLISSFFKNKCICFAGYNFNSLNLICFFLFVGAMGKSAQLGLHTWLPDAMEGPTPVSALIHAATMVTAGVFLLIRCSFLFEHSTDVLLFVSICGAFTSIFAASSALPQNDIKKVIAYSTCSQLGYMIFICGLSNYQLGFFHLINHAVFKALLFLSAGAVIHSLCNEQDLRRFGGVIKLIPFTGIILLIGSLALTGFPFLTGYYSKDVILESSFTMYSLSSSFCYSVGLLTAFFTSFYSYRTFYLTFIYKTNVYKYLVKSVHDSSGFMYITLFILAVGSVLTGFIFKDIFTGIGSDFFKNGIFTITNPAGFDFEATPHFIKLLPFFFTVVSIILLNWLFYNNHIIRTLTAHRVYFFLSFKWYFDVIYNRYINIPILQKARAYLFEIGDKGILEVLGPLGAENIVYSVHKSINKLFISDVVLYGFFIFLSVILSA